MGRNFGSVGLVFAGVECFIESGRGRHDKMNTMAAAVFCGAFFARHGGPQSMAMGAAGFAVFSYLIDWFTERYDDAKMFKHDNAKFEIDNPPRLLLSDYLQIARDEARRFVGRS
jgi:Tim17/Tim22/Tim23/Pmp24 family